MILSNIIDKTKGERTVEPYRFKALAHHTPEPKELPKEPKIALPTDENQEPNDEAINSEPIQNIEEERPNTVESTFREELWKKTDELSGNIVKLQMQIENQESVFKIRLEN